jgi:hypothetical protein
MRPSAEEVSNAIARAVSDLIYSHPAPSGASIGPIRVGLGKNQPGDWWDVKAPRAKRRVNNPAATVWVDHRPVVSVISSQNGQRVLVVLPKGTDVEWIDPS